MGAATSFPAAAKSRPLEGRLPPLRGKMSRSDKRGSVASPQAMTEGVIIGSAAFCESAALRGKQARPLSQALSGLPAPSGREPLARPEGFSLHLMFCNGANGVRPLSHLR